MKYMRRRALSLLLAVLMLVGLLPTSAFAAKGSANMWTETYTGSAGSETISLTVTADGDVSVEYPADASTAGKYYAGMTLNAAWSAGSGLSYDAAGTAAGKWRVNAEVSAPNPLSAGTTYTVEYHDGTSWTEVAMSGGSWASSGKIVVPAASLSTARTLTLSAGSTEVYTTYPSTSADLPFTVKSNVAGNVSVAGGGYSASAAVAENTDKTVTVSGVPAAAGAYTFSASMAADTYYTATTSGTVSVTVKSGVYDTASGTLSAVPAAPVVGSPLTLTLSGLKAKGDGQALVYGTDYTVVWKASDGTQWGDAVGTAGTSAGGDAVFTVANIVGTEVSYKAVVSFKGNFAGNPDAEILLGAVSDKADPATAQLSVKQGASDVTKADEGSQVTLSVELKNAAGDAITEGTVTYYADGLPFITVPAGSSAVYTMPALSGAAKSVQFSARYSGSETYAAVAETATTLGKTVAVKSVTIVGDGVSASASPALAVNAASALSLGGTVKNSAGTALTVTADYTVGWFEDAGDGNWKPCTASVTPLTEHYRYKAVVSPEGDYTSGKFETAPIGGSITKANAGAATLTGPAGAVWQNSTYSFTAGFADAVGGTVDFYRDGVFAASVPLVDHKATCGILLPNAGNVTVKAVYSGSSAYQSAEVSEVFAVKSTTISTSAFIQVGSSWTDKLELGVSNTLTLELYDSSVTNPSDPSATPISTYAEGADYTVIWEVNNGSGWAEFQRGGETASVTPAGKNYSYRAVLLPAGSYTAPANGLVSSVVTASGSVLLATTTVLSVDEPNPFEGSSITLTAAVKQGTGLVGGGNVEFTLPGGATVTVALDSTGTASLTVPAGAYTGAAVTYQAQYQGDGVLYAASTAADVSVASRSVEIVSGTGSYAILSGGAEYTPEEGTTATLSLPAIHEKGTTTSLTYGTDYTADWYVSTDGTTWNLLGSGKTMQVTPASVTEAYKAVVLPVGNYKRPLDGLVFTSTKGTLLATETTLTAAPATVYVGKEVTVTAAVAQTPSGTAVTQGTVYFIDASTGAQLAVQKLDTSGKAHYSFKAVSTDPVSIRAEYSGTGTYAASAAATVLVITPKAPEIEVWYGTAATKAFTVAGAGWDDTVRTMTVGTEYTLTIPSVVDKNDTGTVLTANLHYTVQWLSRNADGSWSPISSVSGEPTVAKVTPDHDKAAYTAIVMPRYDDTQNSYYVLPRTGIAMESLTVGTKLASATVLTTSAAGGEAFEGTTVKLTAKVSEGVNKVNGGSVTFKRDGTSIGTVAVVNGEAVLDVTMPAWQQLPAANTYVYTAEFSGTSAYTSSQDTVGQTVKVRSASLTTASGAVIKIYDGSTVVAPGDVVVGKPYKLEAPSVYAKDDLITALTPNTDYTLEWQYSEDGSTWATVSGTDEELTGALFGNTSAAYRVIIRPAAGADYTMPSSIVVELKPGAAAAETTTTLTANKTICFEGEEIILTASVVKTGTTDVFATGTVKFYQKVSGSGDKFLGYADLTTQGEALLTVTAPAYANGTSVTYYAVYQGNTVYKTSTSADVSVAIQSAKITSSTKTIAVDPVVGGPLVVGTAYTLTIPKIYRYGDAAETELVVGTDYTVTWQVITDSGATWSDLGSYAGNSITITPATKNSRYRAVVAPAGSYKGAIFGTAAVPYLEMDPVGSQVVGTQTTLTVTDTAGKYGSETLDSQYEGENVTLTATVKENNAGGALVTSGYVYFYRDGSTTPLNTVPVNVVGGVAQLSVPMTAWAAGNTSDTFTAKFMANDSYGESTTADAVEIAIRSTRIAMPNIKSSVPGEVNGTAGDTTTDTYGIENLPAGVAITFTVPAQVTALDGRGLTAGVDYTWQWEQNSNNGMFVAIGGANANSYALPSPYGVKGDSFRLTLKPVGHMTLGNTSNAATIGTLANPAVALDVTKPYAAGGGSHYGDEVTLSATVTGASARPTGYVTFHYMLNGGTEVQIGDPVKLAEKPLTAYVAEAKISTTALPQGVMDLYVKYYGDKTFAAEQTTLDPAATTAGYKVWSVEIENTDDAQKLSISITKRNGAATTETVLTAGSTYELTLRTPIYTEDGQVLTDAEYDIEWQESTNGVDWSKVAGATDSPTCIVKPATEQHRYRAVVTTTKDLFAEPKTDSRLDNEVSNIIGASVQAVSVVVTTNKAGLPAPYTDAVYAGNEITLYAQIIPSETAYTVDPTGKVAFYYAVAGTPGTIVEIPSSDPLMGGSNEANVVKRDGKFYAAITTTALPADAAGKMQDLYIVAQYSGDGTYDELKPIAADEASDRKVTVYSSKVFALDTVQNKVISAPKDSTAGIIIYAPEDVLVSDGAPTVLTLKSLYTLDAQDGTNEALVVTPGEYTYLAENTNYSVKWQYTTAFNPADPANSTWHALDGVGHQVTVAPQAGYAYRAVITVDQSAERTVKSAKTYYSNILKATEADAVLQLRATPASSGGFKDTDLTFDAYVSGGTTVPVGTIQLVVTDPSGAVVVDRTATAVNGHVTFGGGIGDTAGKINLPAGVYTVKAKYTGNSGYATETSEQTYIVRYRAEEVAVAIDETAFANLVYNGRMQRPDKAAVTFNGGAGHTAAQKKADASVVFNYEMKVGDEWKAVDAPFDAGTYRVTAVLPETIYYEAQKSAGVEFAVACKEVSIEDILVQAKVYNGGTDAYILDVELTGVVPGDSVYTTGTAVTTKAEALVANQVTYTATALVGADAANYKFAAGGSVKSENFTIARNKLTVDSFAISGSGLTGLKVYDSYGAELARGTGYTVRYFYHDGTGVKATTNLSREGKYTVVIAPADTANYKGGETFIMNIAAAGAVNFAHSDTAAEKIPYIFTFENTQQDYSAAGNAVSVKASVSGDVPSVSYNVDGSYNTGTLPSNRTGRYGVYGNETNSAYQAYQEGIITLYKIEAEHVFPKVEDKVYDSTAVTPGVVDGDGNAVTAPAGAYYTYTGGEIVGVSYDAPSDVGSYTVTVHVPATAATVAYAETSTFTIRQKEIELSAIAVTKQIYRTNPELRTDVTLLAGDSDLKDFLVLPSFELRVTTNPNPDLNEVGNYTIVPFGVVSRNYKVVAYHNADFAVQATDPAAAMEIVGLPNGQVYYGDAFRVSLYGTVAGRVDGNGTYNNPSSVINWYVSDTAVTAPVDTTALGKTTSSGVTIDNDGNVSIKGTAAQDFYIIATRGTGDYKVYTSILVDVEKRPIYISMNGLDTKEYNGTAQDVDVSKYTVSNTLNPGDVTLTTANMSPSSGKDVGEYLITASYSDGKYVGTGKGLMTITRKPAYVQVKDQNGIYGDEPWDYINDQDKNYYNQVTPYVSDELVTESTVWVSTNAVYNDDVGTYELFMSGTENPNYEISYKSGWYTAAAKALTTAKAGVDDLTADNKVTAQVKREYGVVNPQMGYQIDGFIDNAMLAELLIDDAFVVYARKQEDNANLSGADNVLTTKGIMFVNGYADGDGYGLIDLHDSLANINPNALNYTMTPADGLLDIFQKNITVMVQDLTAKTGESITNDSYRSEVIAVLTAAPMNDTIADLGLTYAPVGTAGTAPCVYNADVSVTLKSGSTTLTAADYFAQNYYRTNSDTAKLYVDGAKVAAAAITADKSGANIHTTDPNVPANEYIQVYTKTGTGASAVFTATGKYIKRTDVTTTADADNADYVDVNDSVTLCDASGTALTPAESTDADSRALKADFEAVKTVPVNVGNINYVVLDKNGVKVASGTMTQPTDPTKVGQYSDTWTPQLAAGDYTIVLDMQTTGGYTLIPNLADFTVSGGGSSGGGSSGGFTGGGSTTPTLEKKDHFAFMRGDQAGAFRPDDNLTRAEAAQIFYNLLTDKTPGDKAVSFPDVPAGVWYAKAANVLASYGIIKGLPDGTFGPERSISRAEFAALACRFDELTTGTATFSDVDESHWAYQYIAFAAEKGWVTGYTDGTFRPGNNITRCEVVALICRVLERSPDKNYIGKHSDELKLFPDVAASHWAYHYIVEATNGHNYTKDSKGNETWSSLK